MIFNPTLLFVVSFTLAVAAVIMSWVTKSQFQTVWFLRRAEILFAVAILISGFMPDFPLWVFALALLMLTSLVLAVKESNYRKYLEEAARPVSTEKEE